MAGTLTDAAGEPAVIETVDEDSFERVRFAFFTGSAGFSARHGMEARRSGAAVIDLSGGLGAEPGVKPWIPVLDLVLPSPPGKTAAGEARSLFLVPSTPAQIAISISAALAPLGLEHLTLTIFRPASERGREAIEELETQVVKLLSFQPISQAIFDAQVGFNMLSRYGPESSEKLADVRAKIIGEVRNYLGGRAPMPAIALVQAPVFHAHAFTAYAEFKSAPALEDRWRSPAKCGPENHPRERGATQQRERRRRGKSATGATGTRSRHRNRCLVVGGSGQFARARHYRRRHRGETSCIVDHKAG